jgi:hypothetical protein
MRFTSCIACYSDLNNVRAYSINLWSNGFRFLAIFKIVILGNCLRKCLASSKVRLLICDLNTVDSIYF